MQEPGSGLVMLGGGGGSGGMNVVDDISMSSENIQSRQLKGEIATHPLCEQLLAAHVGCLRVATPIDHLPLIDAQLAQSHHLLRFYAASHQQNQHHHRLSPQERQDLDNFLAQYLLVLCSFKEQLQQHVRVHAVEAVMACREIEQSFQAITGVSLSEGTGATMTDDEDDLQMDCSLDQSGGDGHDMMGFGPLLPTESERSLMERVREELKIELKQGFRSKIEDVREEILRKRRAGKLPGDTTSVLKNWWQQHAKWPYPTEDDKTKLVEETGLQLKQINNWFINQRKRNWHSNSQSITALKTKRKRTILFKDPILSSSNTKVDDNEDDLVVVAIYGQHYRLAFCRPGDESWTCLQYELLRGLADVTYDRMVKWRGEAVAFDLHAFITSRTDDQYYPKPKVVIRTVVPSPMNIYGGEAKYIVESSGDLLQVRRFHDPDDDDARTIMFRVFKLLNEGEEKYKWEEVKSLRGQSLFVGDNASMSLTASEFSGCMPNCIYFTDDSLESYPYSTDLGVFNLIDGSIEQHYKIKTGTSICPPPIWVQPTLES